MKKLALLAVFVLVLTTAVPVSAEPLTETGCPTSENFDSPVTYRTPGGPAEGCWAIYFNNFQQSFGTDTDPEGILSLVRQTESGGDNYIRLTKRHDDTPTYYMNVEYSELQTGVSVNQAVWSPTPGHPVIFSETVRFGPNYGQDGSGGAVGSAGMGFWNSYPDNTGAQHPITAIWFSWNEAGAGQGFIDGLTVNVVNNGNFAYLNNIQGPQYPLNMQDWMTITIGWFAMPGGMQQIHFTVTQNGHTYNAGQTVVSGIPGLSFTNWNDNILFSGFGPDGSPIIQFQNPATEDYLDISSISVFQP